MSNRSLTSSFLSVFAQRNHHYQRRGTALLRIEGCGDKKGADFYCGKRVAFVYKAKVAKTMKGHYEGKSKVGNTSSTNFSCF